MFVLLQLRIALVVTWKIMVISLRWTWLVTLWTVKLVMGLFSSSKHGGSR